MRTSPQGIALIESFEGVRYQAYLDTAGIPSIGVGHTEGVKMGDTCTQAQAYQWLSQDLSVAELCVNDSVKALHSQAQFDALVSFVFNVGVSAFRSSTLLKHLNAGDYVGSAAQFTLWDKSGGLPTPGLMRRRLKERDVFLGGYK